MENPFDHPQDRQPASSPWAPSATGAPAPPPRPPSNNANTGNNYQNTSYASGAYNPYSNNAGGYNQFGAGGGPYTGAGTGTGPGTGPGPGAAAPQNGYENPYGGFYDQPAYDNPNSLFTSTGAVVSNQSLPTPTVDTTNPFMTPGGGNHPSLYNDNPSLGAQSRYSSVNADRYNSPAPLPGQSTIGSTSSPHLSPPSGRRRVQLVDNPASLAPGYPPTRPVSGVGEMGTRYGDEEGAGGDGAEMSLLRAGGGGGGGHGADRFSVGGFDPTLLNPEDDDNFIR